MQAACQSSERQDDRHVRAKCGRGTNGGARSRPGTTGEREPATGVGHGREGFVHGVNGSAGTAPVTLAV
jgi:hypothetical protein